MQGSVKALNFAEGLLVAVSWSTLGSWTQLLGRGRWWWRAGFLGGRAKARRRHTLTCQGMEPGTDRVPVALRCHLGLSSEVVKIISPRRDHTRRAYALGSFKYSSLRSSSKAQGLRKRNFCPWRKRMGMASTGELLQVPAPSLLSLPREAGAQIQQWAYSWWRRFMCPWHRRRV